MTATVDEVLSNLDRLENLLAGKLSDQPIDTATYGDVMRLESQVDTFVAANQVPTGGQFIGMFNTTCPTGWTRVTAFDDKFLVGKATYGGTGGATTHKHTMSGVIAHTHSEGSLSVGSSGSHNHSYVSPYQTNNFNTGATTGNRTTSSTTMDGNWPSHDHSGAMSGSLDSASVAGSDSGNSGTASNLPPYTTVMWCSKN
ncbi:MAG: hypothetical protein A2W28_09735 [Gammaproteobacteria bacterium RBG_16_51_14]|nr:MAG: hypothetical protein A2W28_09735 [Gammaproteobacteria bacterium RBG_16_51_14]